MLDYNQIKERRHIILEGTVYEVIASQVSRKQARKPVNQTKIKNLMTGGLTERSFGSNEKAEEADISKKDFTYLYSKFNRQTNENELWFALASNPKERFELNASVIGDSLKYMKPNSNVVALVWTDKNDEEITIGIKLPIKVTLEVAEAPPSIKGNTATGGNKVVTLENGTKINAPLFIEVGESIVINTETGEYVERSKEDKKTSE